MAVGTKGSFTFGDDFLGAMPEATVPATTGVLLPGGLALSGVNEGSFVGTFDESGGVLAITTDVGDDDNQVLYAGMFVPSDGGMWMETRFKIPTSVAATREAIFVGFAETLSKTTPVMPFERATATNTFNGTGGMFGVAYDGDSTILECFAVSGDGGAGIAGRDKNSAAVASGVQQITGAAGVPGGTVFTADRWYIVRVEIDPSGLGRVYFGDYDGGGSLTEPLELVYTNTTALGTGDLFHAVCMIENRAAANEELEVDYFIGGGGRDWRAT